MVKKVFYPRHDKGGHKGPPLQNSLTLTLSQGERGFGLICYASLIGSRSRLTQKGMH